MNRYKQASKSLDLSELDEFSYSSVLREVRSQLSPEEYIDFIKIYKGFFDKAYLSDKENVKQVSMCKTLLQFGKKITIDLDKNLFKEYMGESIAKDAANKYFNLIKSGFNINERTINIVKAELVDMENSNMPVVIYINSDINKYGALKEKIVDILLEHE
jgi:hypothetical protein